LAGLLAKLTGLGLPIFSDSGCSQSVMYEPYSSGDCSWFSQDSLLWKRRSFPPISTRR